MENERKKNHEADELLQRFFEGEDFKKPGEELSEVAIIKELGEQVNESFRRGRTALLVVFLASLVLGVGVFNHRGSWLYTVYYGAEQKGENELKEPIDPLKYNNDNAALIAAINRNSENDKPDYQRHLLHDVWDGNFKTLDVPALGIEFYVADLPLVGSFGILLVFFWFYIFRRREKGIIRIIYQKVKTAYFKDKKHIVEYLYNAIALNQVFNTIKGLDDVIDQTKQLDGEKPVQKRMIRLFYFGIPVIVFILFLVDVFVFPDNAILRKFTFVTFLIVGALFYTYLFIRLSRPFPKKAKKFKEKLLENKYIRKWQPMFSISHVRKNIPLTNMFLAFGLLAPLFILTFVLFHDIYETYWWETRNLYVPTDSLVTELRNTKIPIKLPYFYRNDTAEVKYTVFDSAKIYMQENVYDPIDSVFYRSADSLRSVYGKDESHTFNRFMKQLIADREEKIEKQKHQCYNDATLFEYIKSNKLIYKKLNRSSLRIFGMFESFSLEKEVFWLRSVFPCFLLFICYTLSMSIFMMQWKMEKYFDLIHALYTDNIPNNYFIDGKNFKGELELERKSLLLEEVNYFKLQSGSILAFGKIFKNKFLVFKGSTAKGNYYIPPNDFIGELRNNLINDQKVLWPLKFDSISHNYIFLQEYLFESSADAKNVILGKAQGGEWENRYGISIDTLSKSF